MTNNENTPIEEYSINGHDLFVKREDLFLASAQPICPALAKLRGARKLLEKWKENGWNKIAVYDTRISKAGQGISYLCKELGLTCAVGFPVLKGQTEFAPQQKIAKELGATLVAVQAGRTNICYSRFKHEMELRSYRVLPLGLTCAETVIEVRKVARELLIKFGTVVLSTGTGTIATGVALGIQETNNDCKVIGVSCGMSPERQWKRIREMAVAVGCSAPSNLTIVPPEYDYYTALDTSKCSFPTSPYYDMKAYSWLLGNIEKLKEPVCFWNIGV